MDYSIVSLKFEGVRFVGTLQLDLTAKLINPVHDSTLFQDNGSLIANRGILSASYGQFIAISKCNKRKLVYLCFNVFFELV